MNFTHLHVHSYYSEFDGMARVIDIVDKCIATGMNAVALTDHGNMSGAKDLLNYCKFINEERKLSGIKPFVPIVGVEVYCARRGRHLMSDDIDRGGWHLILLAKNKTGYQNLCRLVSESNKEDAFYIVPRIDHELLEQYHEGLICCSACIGGELPQKVLNGLESGDMSEARKTVEWFKNLFGEDYYIELQRHETQRQGANQQIFQLQSKINPVLIDLAHEYGVKIICSNDSHYVNAEEADTQDLIMCKNSNKSGDDQDRIRFSKQEWLKSPEEMEAIFRDIPEALSNTQEIVDKIELYDIDHVPILPKLELPLALKDYLRQQVLNGGIERYGEEFVHSPAFELRVETELNILCANEDVATYLLIVADIVSAAREMGIMVGPGRSSAAGSLVNYCLKITDIDPLKYGLLFESFYTDTDTLPDIDIDVEDCERDRLIEYLVHKYGKEHVAHIIWHRFEDSTCRSFINDCGIAICGEELHNILPLTSKEDSKLHKRIIATGYNGNLIESVGVVKLDILGLKVLTEIKHCLQIIKQNYGIDLDINAIPLDDELTIRLFQEGRTEDAFQFQAEGMRKHMQELVPTAFEDLVALNALYRPGAMIITLPQFIARKRGIEPVQYALPIVEDILKETCGIFVYNEQVMLLCQRIASFTPAESKILIRALYRKSPILGELKRKFINQGLQNGYEEEALNSIWNDISENAHFVFSKSHAVCYTWLAYQAAYLKAHYPDAFQKAVGMYA